MKKAEKARAFFEEGYNCCQAVVLAFAEDLGVDEKAALAISSSFGGGIGGMGDICGAVSGMVMVAGLKWGYTDPKATIEKQEHYHRIRELCDTFQERRGSLTCRILKSGKDRNFCADLVYEAASILEKEF